MQWKKFIDNNLLNHKGTLYHFVGLKPNLDKRFPGVFDKIISETPFLLFENPIREKLYCLYHGITIRRVCEFCNINFAKFMNFKNGYRPTCGNKNCYKKFLLVIQENGKTFAQNRARKSANTIKESPLIYETRRQHIIESKKELKMADYQISKKENLKLKKLEKQ